MSELLVDLDRIRRNTAAVTALLGESGLDLVAVTKACLGEPLVARAMLDGGAVALADTRDASLARLRRVFPDVELHRIHLPPLSRSFVSGDYTYVSNAAGLEALARRVGDDSAPRRCILMVESGDEREGVPREAAVELARAASVSDDLELAGLATNYACFAGPPEGLARSVGCLGEVAADLEEAGLGVERVSGGNSAVLGLLREGGGMPPAITELRCGEALLYGHDTLTYRLLPGAAGPACTVKAEVLERYTKAPNARADRGDAAGPRVVLDVGSQDLGSAPATILRTGLREAGRSSDYLVAEEAPGARPAVVGELVALVPSYYALVAAWSSPFVEVRFE